MTSNLTTFSQQYLVSLRKYVDHGSRDGLRPATRLGHETVALGLQAPALAKIHRKSLGIILPVGDKFPRLSFERTQTFFVQTVISIEATRDAQSRNAKLLEKRNVKLVAEVASLAEEVGRLKIVATDHNKIESALRQSITTDKERYVSLLRQSQVAQGQLRRLSHNILSAQEEQRKEISRELHDEVAQTLAGIGVHLAALMEAATLNTLALKQKIKTTQFYVERSVNIVHQFARELRPALLDDLGLIPALQSRIRTFTERTTLPVEFTADSSVEQLSSTKRTVLYRVAQEALTNVARHAKATKVVVTVKEIPGFIVMEIKDNGKAFNVEHALSAQRSRRLGLIGMRERVEMSGGEFRVESIPARGTTVLAQIPIRRSKSA